MNSLEFLHNYCDFSNPNWVWIMTGIARNKDNDAGEKFLRRYVIAKPDDIELCWYEIHALARDPKTLYRIYISLNARDAVKAAFMFQKKMADVTFGLAKGQDDALHLSKKLGSLWKTELAQMHNRGTKRFLLDLDNTNQDKANNIHAYLRDITTVHFVRETVNGYHIVFDACDTRGLMEYCKQISAPVDLQKDSMVFVEQFLGE